MGQSAPSLGVSSTENGMKMATNANTTIYDRALDRAAMIRLYERRVNGKISLVLDGHEVRLDKLIKDANNSQKGFDTLKEAIDQELNQTYKETFNISKRSLLDLVSDQISFTFQTVESSMGKIWKAERPLKRVAEEIVLEKPLFADKTLAQGWAGVSVGERKRIEAVIRRGISENWTIDQIALEARRGNVINITRSQSKALVITAITSVTAQTDHEIYKANEKAITGWQYVAVLDSRTTPLCAHRDGSIYPVSDTNHLPPAHFHCRSTTIPVFKDWNDISKLEGVAQVRKRNIQKLSNEELSFYDGQTPMRESYNEWLLRQPQDVQIRHIGDYQKVELFRSGQLQLDKFTNPEGNSIGINELRKLTDSGYSLPNDTKKFALAKEKLDAMQLGASTPDDLINDIKLKNTLKDYYLLQASELNGILSITNYRGTLLQTKRGAKNRVLTSPPREDQLKFNPITGRYEDVRLYQPNPSVLANNIRLVDESEKLLPRDKEFINKFVDDLSERMSINERAVITDNLRIIFGRYRDNKEVWSSLKGVIQGQIKFDVMNVSDAIETQLRKDSDFLKKLLQSNYIDPVLGPTQLQDLHDNFIDNIMKRNRWEDKVAPKIASELRNVFDYKIPLLIKGRISDRELQQFYLRFAHRLSLADTPDRDQFAVSLGRDLYNLANLNGERKKWYNLGMSLLEAKNVKEFFEVETFGVQKRRMKSKMSGQYFGPYYDTLSYNIRVVDPRIQEYAQLTRKVDVGLRVGVTEDKNRLVFREGYKTYFIDRGILGYEDTRIPITSSSSFSEFPEEFIDKDFVNALNWASKTKYKIDKDYFNFAKKILYFEDDRGNAKKYNELNEYRKYIASRGDAYERFKAMEWLAEKDTAFSNHPFIDHRARIYDRGLISPQSGETFRPFLNTEAEKSFSNNDFRNLQDQIGAFMGGLNDFFEGKYNSLSFSGRQKISTKWRPELVKIGNHMLKSKPADIRAILESEVVSKVDGEDINKFFRFALETAKIDNFLEGDYSLKSLERLTSYKTALALEQDASSSGAQIIALTTKNKQLAELSNVVPTTQKKRLYDEIAAATYNDARFRELNKKLGLNEKDLRKAAKAQNMVTFYGAGERTSGLNVEGKLSKVLGKDVNTLVVKASDRDIVLNEISARIARYQKFDPETTEELRVLRENVKDIFNKGMDPGDEILDQLYFLDSKTKDLVEKLSQSYEKVVTPDDFKQIARIMSEYLSEQVPILRDFTKYFGRLAEDFLANAKPSNSDFDWKAIIKTSIRGSRKKGYVLPDSVSNIFGLTPGEVLSEKVLKRFGFWKPDGTLSEIIYGISAPEARRTGAKYFKLEIPVPTVDVKKLALGKEVPISEVEVFYANKLPKSWTNVPWANFDGKIIEQNFTQQFEERLVYKDKFGNWTTNVLQVPQKTEATWWDQVINKSGKINDIADLTRARTAFAVNGNHSNDAVIVKKFHLWGKDNKIPTSTIHDAFFTNAADMLKAREALRSTYADMLKNNVIKMTLDEMKARGLPKDLYDSYLAEAIEKGLIPVPGKSVVGGKVLTENDILKREDILKKISTDFTSDYGWYGVN
jgi:SPP1 gp7 family putative phage head morphogenesis protein